MDAAAELVRRLTSMVYKEGSAAVTVRDMRNSNGERSPVRSLRKLNESLRKAGPAATAGYSLIGAVLLFAGIGYALDRWLQTSPLLTIGGLMLGLVVGFYQLAMTVWRR